MKNNTRLTTRRRILLYINQELEQTGCTPSLRQIAKAVGLSSPSSVKRHTDILEQEGLIYLGSSAAKTNKHCTEVPVYTEKELLPGKNRRTEKTLFLPYRDKETLFALKMPDDALSGLGILAGDFVIAEQDFDLQNGDKGLFWIENRLYPRIFKVGDGNFVFEAANEMFEDISCSDFICAGKIIAVQRLY